jgi:hypothetical protein
MHRLPASLRRLLAVLALASTAASAQTYPARPIEWVVPYPAGGGSDVVARALTEAMGQALGQPLVINNKPGAATNIGAEYVAHAKPDGYTVLTGDTATLAANPALYTKLSYSAEKDLAPIGLLARFPMILVVNPAVPAKTWPSSRPGPRPRRAASATPRRAPAARTTWRPSCSAARPASTWCMCLTAAPHRPCRTWRAASCPSCLSTPPAAWALSMPGACAPSASPARSA